MPGQRSSRGTFTSAFKIYRILPAADTIPDLITQTLTMDHPKVVDGKDNIVHLQIIVPATVTGYDIELWGDTTTTITDPNDLIDPDTQAVVTLPTDATRWAIIDGLKGRTSSSFISLDRLPAVKELRVAITNVAGTVSAGTPIIILYSVSA